MGLTEQQIERYSRHIILEEVGGQGQEKLLASKVLIIGAGGVGAPTVLYIAWAGIGSTLRKSGAPACRQAGLPISPPRHRYNCSPFPGQAA